ncbi:hypothetical protein GGI25_003871 [Coemansia spiralis]|uniref:Uncharacterized protein n=2 Tax=Coemansia TaxID=4863 RepID=A0A9W8G5N9_9FUNG|nr:hypothetical protein EDC05_003738 [Coemansia umbellata]KAJ2621027.1 hypothetical protein GGI26_004528 [Coemansia sp. RSA 1358]KAJ2675776.1 hypothetical protein GGI25_003871 [Coemansia spiralis]
MECFIDTVKSKTFQLHPVDTQAAFLNIPYHFFYSNLNNMEDFMPSSVLKTGFYKALCHFPILAGQLQSDSSGIVRVVVDPSRLNMPEYIESVSEIPFEALRKSNFHWSAWPQGLTTTSAITTAAGDGIIKLLNVHVVRMKDNSGVIIFVNIPHYVVDGTGFFSFVELWGNMCRVGHSGNYSYCFSREIISQNLPSNRKPLDADTVQIYTEFNPLADWLAWLSPKSRGWLLSKAQFKNKDVSSSTFRVPRSQLAELRRQVCQHLSREESATVEDTYVLAAAISMIVAQAHKACKEQGHSDEGNITRAVSAITNQIKHFYSVDDKRNQSLSLLADLRKGLGITGKNYMGNGLIPHSIQCPLDMLEVPIDAKSLAQPTRAVTNVYTGADAPLVASFIDMITERPSCFTRPMLFLAKNPTSLVITNETGFKLYKADFGAGYPEWVCSIPSFVANFVGFLPGPPPSTDIIVNIIMRTPVLKSIVANKFWQTIATPIY